MDTNDLKNSLGIINEMMLDADKEEKKFGTTEPKNQSTSEEGNQNTKRSKRGYDLKPDTIRKLNEMKVFMYPTDYSLSDIVDEAICKLYESKKTEKGE